MYLTESEVKNTYYPAAKNMSDNDVKTYLKRANSYAQGIIGGAIPEDEMTAEEQENLKTAVAMAFEIMSKGNDGQVNETTGNITQAAPSGFFVRREKPLNTVKEMLRPFADLYDRLNTETAEKGVKFI